MFRRSGKGGEIAREAQRRRGGYVGDVLLISILAGLAIFFGARINAMELWMLPVAVLSFGTISFGVLVVIDRLFPLLADD